MDGLRWYCGMDLGYRSPTVVLWGAVDAAGVLWIVDERVKEKEIVAEHARAILAARWPRPEWIGIDPSGAAVNDQTGKSAVEVLRAAGLKVRVMRRERREGLELVRGRLRPAGGGPVRLRIHARCRKLIESIESYKYPAGRPWVEEPEKKGPDHAVDALRYLVVNLDGERGARRGNYLGGATGNWP